MDDKKVVFSKVLDCISKCPFLSRKILTINDLKDNSKIEFLFDTISSCEFLSGVFQLVDEKKVEVKEKKVVEVQSEKKVKEQEVAKKKIKEVESVKEKSDEKQVEDINKEDVW